MFKIKELAELLSYTQKTPSSADNGATYPYFRPLSHLSQYTTNLMITQSGSQLNSQYSRGLSQ